MMAAFSFLLIGNYSIARVILLGLTVAFVIVGFFALTRKRWAMIISIIWKLIQHSNQEWTK